ncbi:MAG: zinc-dependent alcohol dehydrogenase [Luteibaculaceae bacterium]
MEATALWHVNTKESKLITEEIKASGEANVLINAHYSLVSRGTESLVKNGLVPDELKENMRVNYMGGSFNFPIKYGYSMVGETAEGAPVHLMHPHQSKFFVKAADLYFLPKNLPLKRAALLSNLETTLNAVWDAQLKGHEKVAIVGFGGIAALLALTLRLYAGVEPRIKELNPTKQNKALELGFSPAEGAFDVIFNTSASENGLQFAIDNCRKDGKVVELSWYGNRPLKVNLGGNFHYNRVHLISSQVSTVSPFAPLQGFKARKDEACKLLVNQAFEALLTQEIDFANSPVYFSQFNQPAQENDLITIIKY